MKSILIRDILKRTVIAIASVLLAALIRKYFLHILGGGIVWLTFYPAVMAAAFFAGFWAGLFAIFLSCSVALWCWPFFVDVPFIHSKADWIGLSVFVLNCTLVSAIAQYSRFQSRKATIEKEKAEAANRSKSVFLANMSHELRTPLNSILGFTQLMQAQSNLNDEERRYFEIINKSGHHLLDLINNVLDISKIEAGQTIIDVGPFNLKKTIQEVVYLMTLRAEEKGLKLEFSIEEQIPTYINTDEVKFKQVLINLLGNAVKFTDQGGVKLTISTQNTSTVEKNNLLIVVEDTGVGIPSDDIQKVFQPFVQSVNHSSKTGTGLGLTISKQYIELLGGCISVDSKLGVFSRFTVTLPYSIPSKADVPLDTNRYQRVLTVEPQFSNTRILIVEDQPENWLLLQKILEMVGLKSRVAENGQVGVELFESWQPQLIFMDVRMPVMDGLEASSKIRTLPTGNQVKIIGISAHVFKEEIQNILDVGMDGFIKKPYLFHEIYECIHNQLGVEFVFDNQPKGKALDSDPELSAEMLKKIEPEYLEKFRYAILNYEKKDIEDVVQHISTLDPQLSSILSNYILNLRYTELNRILTSISTKQ